MFGESEADFNFDEICTGMQRQMMKTDATLRSLEGYTNAYIARTIQAREDARAAAHWHAASGFVPRSTLHAAGAVLSPRCSLERPMFAQGHSEDVLTYKARERINGSLTSQVRLLQSSGGGLCATPGQSLPFPPLYHVRRGAPCWLVFPAPESSATISRRRLSSSFRSRTSSSQPRLQKDGSRC